MLMVLSSACFGVADGWYVILSRESGKVLTVDLATVAENSANVKQWTYRGEAHQVWWIENVGGGQYKIINKQSGKALVVDGSTRDLDGANVKQFSYESRAEAGNHRWRFVDAGGGYYRIVSAHSSQCLELDGSSHANGANIQQRTGSYQRNQDWLVQPYVDCTWTSDEVQPLLISGHWKDALDVVFVPEDMYAGDLAGFQDDVWAAIRDGYMNLAAFCIDPIPADYMDLFNFYWYWGSDFAEWKKQCEWWLPGEKAYKAWMGWACTYVPALKTYSCAGVAPSWFVSQAPWTDTAAVLAPADSGCAKGLVPPSRFAAPAARVVNAVYPAYGIEVLMHESGHAIFGLNDTYCGNTHYEPSIINTNIWSTYLKCLLDSQAESWTLGKCCEIEEWFVSKNVYRYDDNLTTGSDMMDIDISGARFYEASTRRIAYFLDGWPFSALIDQMLGVATSLHFSEGRLTHLHTTMVEGYPNVGLQSGPLEVLAKSATGEVVGQFQLFDPRAQFPPKGADDVPAFVDDVGFTIVYPYYDNMAMISIVDSETGETLLDVDLSAAL